MNLTLQEILTLVGRLDDAPGFDTPRERFRLYVAERVTDGSRITALLGECQDALGDQHVRARQDLIVMLGRFLGFDVTFGGCQAETGSVRLEGQWRSRRQARIVVEVRSEQTRDSDVEDLSRIVATLAAGLPPDVEERCVGLCVTTPFYVARRRLESLLADREPRNVRCISVDSLSWLAAMASAGRLAHADVLRLLTTGTDCDSMIDVLRRFTETVPAPSDGASNLTGFTDSALR
jgi:hypothetical protein